MTTCKCGQPFTRRRGRGRYCETCWTRRMNERCEASVSVHYGVDFHRCAHPGTVVENGRRYCRQHAPSAVLAKWQAATALSDAKAAVDRRRSRLQARREELWEYMVGEYRRLYRIDPQVAYLNAVEAALKELEGK